MRWTLGLLPILFLLIPAALDAASPPKKPSKSVLAQRAHPDAFKTPLQSMVAAEQAFAKMAAEKGIRAAFLANLSEDAVVFRPLPVNGRDSYRSRPETNAHLAWSPAYGEIAAAGDFGVTCGPWQYTPPPGQANSEDSYGTFLSVWRRAPSKEWKVVLDCGVSHAKSDSGVDNPGFVAGPEHAAPDAAASPPGAGGLQGLDVSFSRMASSSNASQAVAFWTTDDVRYLRDDDPPRLGGDARNAMGATRGHASWRPAGSGISRSADLGYSYGVREDSPASEGAAPDSTVYVHVWRRSGDQWKMSAVVDLPIRRH